MNMVVALLLALQDPEIVVRAGDDLAAVLGRAGKGAVVTLDPGRHAPGQLTIVVPGLTVRSKPGGRAVVDFAGRGGFYLKGDGISLIDLDILNAQNFGVDIDASDCRLEGCRILGSGGDAVKLSPGDWRNKRYNRGATIVRCEIGGNRQFEGVDCVGHDDVRIIDCWIRDTPGWGVYLKGGASRGLIEGCLFERTGTLAGNPAGGACLGEHTGPDEVMTNKHGQPWESVDSTVRNCVFLDIPSAAMAAWCTKNATFANNTVVDAATADRAAFIVLGNHGLPSTDVTFVNNVVVGSAKGNRPLVWLYDKGAAGKLVFQNNLWFGGNGRFWHASSGGPVPFADWQAKHGFDCDSLFADPKLDGFRPTAQSPFLGMGRTLPVFTRDVDGASRSAPWDLGADQRNAGPARALRLFEGK